MRLSEQGHGDELGELMYYGARYYLPGLRRFISADTIVPGAGNPQAFNRYSYVLNNPVRYTDPSGHCGADSSSEYGVQEAIALAADCEALRDELEEQYEIDITGEWTLLQMEWLRDILEANAAAVGHERFVELLKAGAASEDPSIDHLTITMVDAPEYDAAGNTVAPAGWHPSRGTIELTDELFDDSFILRHYPYDPDPKRARDFIFSHEVGHVVVDALRTESGKPKNTLWESRYDNAIPDTLEFYGGGAGTQNESLASEYANWVTGLQTRPSEVNVFMDEVFIPAIRGISSTRGSYPGPMIGCKPFEPC